MCVPRPKTATPAANPGTAMIPTEILKKVRRIQILTTALVNDVFAGQYHSAFKARGMEFEEVREYQPGDDVRTIDWNVTARMGRPFVKNFREERELTVFLLVDVSASQDFGTRKQLKSEFVAELGATLAFSAVQSVRTLAALGRLAPQMANSAARIAIGTKEFDLAQSIIADWQRWDAADPRALRLRMLVEHAAGAYGPAIQAADALLALQPDDAEALRVKKQSQQKLRAIGSGQGDPP